MFNYTVYDLAYETHSSQTLFFNKRLIMPRSQSNMSQLQLAPMVVAQRLPLLWLEMFGFSPLGRRESERMVTEKVEAVSEGIIAAHWEVVSTFIDVGAAMMTGKSPAAAALRGHQSMMDAAVKPAAKHVRSNLRRLSSAA
jgi:hypothetical protein